MAEKAIPEALYAFYTDNGLSDEVIARCETARKTYKTWVSALRLAHDALAASGTFKEWCAAADINYNTAMSALKRTNDKQQGDGAKHHRSLVVKFGSDEERNTMIARLRDVITAGEGPADDWGWAVGILVAFWFTKRQEQEAA